MRFVKASDNKSRVGMWWMVTALVVLLLFSGCAPLESRKAGAKSKQSLSQLRETARKSAKKRAVKKARARTKRRAELRAEMLAKKTPPGKALTPQPTRPPAASVTGAGAREEKPRLTELQFKEFPGGLRVSVGATSVMQYTAFMLSNPARLVINILSTEVGSLGKPMEINKEPVKAVKGTYLEKKDISRLEMELTGEVPYSIERAENRIVVNLFNKPEAQAQVMEKRPGIKITALRYQELEDQVRVETVFAGRNPQFKVVKLKEPLRLVLEIVDATVEQERKLEPEKPVGALRSVDLRRSEKAGRPTAKIVALLTRATPYIVYQEGDSIKLDIDNPPPPPAPEVAKAEREAPLTAPEKAPVLAPREALREAPPAEEKVPERGVPVKAEAPAADEGGRFQGVGRPAGGKYSGTRISLDFQDAELTDILRLIAEVSGYNIITGPGVSGRVNMKMERVPWDQAMDLILKTRNFDYLREGNVLWVDQKGVIEREKLERQEREEEARAALEAEKAQQAAAVQAAAAPSEPAPAEPVAEEEVQYVTRIFAVNYVSTNRTGTGGLSTGGGDDDDDSSGGGGGTTVEIVTEDTTDIWGTLTEGLNAILFGDSSTETTRSEGNKTLIVNRYAGIVQITTTPEEMALIAEFLQTMEESVLRQVMIEANIVEVILSDEFQMGIDWTLVADIAGDLSGGLSGGGLAAQSLASNTNSFQFSVTDNDNIRVFLDALSVQGQINTLSNPKIATLNNQKAIIKVGNEEVFFDVVTTVSQGVSVTTATPRTITVGVVMDVTPHVTPNDLITMSVHPSVTALVGTAVEPTTGARAPLINTRETDTVVTLKNGQTLVLAGLIQDRVNMRRSSVPFLGKIPLLGVLFRKSFEEKNKSELVIFITPTIIEGEKITDITEKRLDLIKKAPNRFVN